MRVSATFAAYARMRDFPKRDAADMLKRIRAAGLLSLLLAASITAYAADMPVPGPPPPPFSWTGIYVGGNVGGAAPGGS